jgi:ferrous iron transport protein B
VLADATNLARNLVIVGELLARDEAVVVALNMVDLAKRRGITVDARVCRPESACRSFPWWRPRAGPRRGPGGD